MWKYLDELNCGERFSFKLRQARLGVAAGGHYRGERQGGRLEHGSVGTHLLEQRPASSACRYSVSMFSMLSGGISLVHIFLDKLLRSSFLQEDIPTIWQNSTNTQGFLNTFYLKFGHFPVIPGRSIFYLKWKPSHFQFRVGFLFEQLPLYLQEFHDRGQCLITNQASFVKYPLVEQFATGWAPKIAFSWLISGWINSGLW